MSKHRSERLLKKLHRRWLDDGIVEICRSRYWRNRLLAADIGQEFYIDAEHLQDLPADTVEAVCRYQLHFCVARAVSNEAASYLSRDGYVLFKFWARQYPAVRCYTGNNPLPL